MDPAAVRDLAWGVLIMCGLLSSLGLLSIIALVRSVRGLVSHAERKDEYTHAGWQKAAQNAEERAGLAVRLADTHEALAESERARREHAEGKSRDTVEAVNRVTESLAANAAQYKAAMDSLFIYMRLGAQGRGEPTKSEGTNGGHHEP